MTNPSSKDRNIMILQSGSKPIFIEKRKTKRNQQYKEIKREIRKKIKGKEDRLIIGTNGSNQ